MRRVGSAVGGSWVQLTSFIGREREVSLILALLQQEDVRLLILEQAVAYALRHDEPA